MKEKKYRNGNVTCKTYIKPAGKGYEVGFTFGGKSIFVGNFVWRAEANAWYTQMNKEVRTFAKKYKVGKTYPQAWYRHFLGSHLYNCYYKHLNKVFAKHQRTFNSQFNKDLRKYKTLSRNWTPKTKTPALRAA